MNNEVCDKSEIKDGRKLRLLVKGGYIMIAPKQLRL